MSDAGKTGKYNDLKVRIASAVVLLGGAFLGIWQGQPSVAAFLSAASILMIREYREMIIGKVGVSDAGFWVMCISAVFAIFLASYHSLILSMIIVCSGVLLLFVLEKKHFSWMSFGLIYLAIACTMFTSLRNWPNIGMEAVLWIILVVGAADIGGYFAGRAFGGPKLWPAVSPKKTWSGIVGGWVLALLVGFGFSRYGLGAEINNIIIFSLALALASQAGDLLESAAKRHFGIKDSSNLIPGHGGLLDRFDGQLAAFVLFALVTVLEFS